MTAAEAGRPEDFQQGVSTALVAAMVLASQPECHGMTPREFAVRLRDSLEALAYQHGDMEWRPVSITRAGDVQAYDDYGCPDDSWPRADVLRWLSRGYDAGRAIQVAVGNALDDNDVRGAGEVLADSTRLSPRAAEDAAAEWWKPGLPF